MTSFLRRCAPVHVSRRSTAPASLLVLAIAGLLLQPARALAVDVTALANANAGGANSSIGWVNNTGSTVTIGVLAIGEENNSAAGDFPIVCNIAASARWMWYNPDPNTITNPFRIGSAPNLPNDNNEFLIFRLISELATPTHRSTWGTIKTIYR